MVEKKAFKTHHRNISSVSDISVTVDPIKRADGAEIKIIFLLESDKERNCMFEVIQKCLQDGQSDIVSAVVLNHHWEQFHNDCTGPECVFCVRTQSVASEIKKGHIRRGSADTDVIIQPQVLFCFSQLSMLTTASSEAFLLSKLTLSSKQGGW